MSHLKHNKAIAFDSLAKIADYLDISVDYLIGRTDIPKIINLPEPLISTLLSEYNKNTPTNLYLLCGDGNLEPMAPAINEAASAKALTPGAQPWKWIQEIIKNFSDSVQNEWKLHLYGYNRSIIDGLVKTSTIESNTEVYKKYARALRRDIAIPLKYERRLKARIVWILYFISPCITSKLMLERGKNRMVKSGD